MAIKLSKMLFSLVIALTLVTTTQATQSALETGGPALGRSHVPPAPHLDAKSFVLMDATTGKIMAEKDAHKRFPPASLTKIMTLYIISDALRSGQIQPNDKVRISKKAWQMGGSKMFIKVGDKVPVKDLVQGIIVASGNDACIAMAEHIAGSEKAFVSLMNHQAQLIGMKESHFTDCTGMPDPEHYSSPYDIALLSKALINDFPKYYPWYKQKHFEYNGIDQPNRNRLLWRYEFADGIKTGHTQSAGYCLASSAKQGDMRLISVVMGEPSDSARTDDSIGLLTYGFRFFKTYKVYSAGQSISEPRIWKGSEETIPLGVTEDIVLTIPTKEYNSLKVISTINKSITAPIDKGFTLGSLQVKLDDDVLVEKPLVALQEIPKGSLWSRITDSLSMSVHNMINKGEDDEPADETS